MEERTEERGARSRAERIRIADVLKAGRGHGRRNWYTRVVRSTCGIVRLCAEPVVVMIHIYAWNWWS